MWLGIVHQWLVAQFPADTHDEVWGDNPSPMICGSYAPAGEMTAVEGGYRLTGEYHFSSGVDVSDWAILGVFFPPREDGAPCSRFTIVPKSDFEIDDNWHVMGLTNGIQNRGLSGSFPFPPTGGSLYGVGFRQLAWLQDLQNSLYRYPISSWSLMRFRPPPWAPLTGRSMCFSI